MGHNPASLDVNNCSRVGNKSSPNPKEPVYCVNWYESLEFANTLSEQNGYEPCYTILTKNAVWKSDCDGYRLPTESEWEIAAAQSSISQAWTIKNSEGKTHEVAQFSPNPHGLYDMLGNVWEWTWDGYGPYPKELTKNPKGTDLSGYRVMRGGTWAKGDDKARISDRANFHPAFRLDVTGFRLVRTLQDRDLNNISR
jgi:formylglycine-generating enzyme required for sulfatase activity